MADMRRELAHIHRKGFQQYQNKLGEGVIWYELDAKESQYHDVFNVQGLKYRDGLAVPVLWVIDSEAVQQATREGQRNVGTLRFAVPMQTLRQVGLSDPQDYERHLNDIVLYERTFYSIGAYTPQGRVNRDDLIVGVNAIKMFPDEDMPFDDAPDPALVEPGSTVRPNNDLDLYQRWDNYEPPAYNS